MQQNQKSGCVTSTILSDSLMSEGCRIGWVSDVDEVGTPLVDYPDNPIGIVKAMTTVLLGIDGWRQIRDENRCVVLMFEKGNPACPVIMGLVQSPLDDVIDLTGKMREKKQLLDLELDHERLLIEAKSEIVLRCGKASIILRKDGKVVIKGTSLISRSTGSNKIKGGIVEIN